MGIHIPTTKEIYHIAYLTNCGWEPGFDGGWIHPNKKKFKYELGDDDFIMVEDWPLEDAFWEAYDDVGKIIHNH